jgi:hypothetical protein
MKYIVMKIENVEIDLGGDPGGGTLDTRPALICKSLWNWQWNFAVWETSLKWQQILINVKRPGTGRGTAMTHFQFPSSSTVECTPAVILNDVKVNLAQMNHSIEYCADYISFWNIVPEGGIL